MTAGRAWFARPVGLAALWAFAILNAVQVVRLRLETDSFGLDNHAYWLAGQGGALYDALPGTQDAYLYSPAFAQLISPLTMLPWWAFWLLWLLAEAGVYVWLLARLPPLVAVPLFLLAVVPLTVGNINAFLILVVLLGRRWPALWAFPLLTKVAPGVGLLWFAGHREWRNLGIAVVATGGIVTLSYAIDPGPWRDWWDFLVANRGESRSWFLVALAAAAGLAWYAGRTDRVWLMPVVLLLSSPVVGIEPAIAYLAIGVPGLWARERGASTSPSDPAGASTGRSA